jgi:AraC-like DNA-binding protein
MLPAALPALAGFDFDRHRLFESADLDETRELCGRVFNPHQLRVLGRGQALHARMDHRALGDVSLNRLTWGAAVGVDPDRLDTYYLLSMPVEGAASFRLGDEVVEVSPRCAGIVNASQRFRFEASQKFTQIVVRIERNAIENAWQALTGRPVERPIDFVCCVPTSDAAWRALEPVVSLLARSAADEQHAAALPFLHARLTEVFATMLLLNQPHSASGHAVSGPLGRSAWLAKQAEAYMDEHLEEALTVSVVARACGAPIRTLQAAFNRAHGCGPMAWLRARRLQAVRDALATNGQPAHITIAETALRWGFTHLGEFSRAYRARFGETPSATRARFR